MIRLANESDAEVIVNLRKEIILSEETTKFFASSKMELPQNDSKLREQIKHSNRKGNLIIVAEMDGEVVGYLVFTRNEKVRLRHTGTMGVGIREEHCNQGIGTELIEFLIDWARKQNNLEKICLFVTSINDRAIKVYKRIGFIEEGRQKNQIKYEDGSYGDDIFMAYYM
ncbi:GNAT family N-acetyltransferase [Cytobacillus sp. Hz8]|uniref:GNAT family N-acetyltransferase n=1 Tax=Cytobacillus sp. Hz8 TaxID=3347168 RepID=UPI0035D6785F